MSRNTDLADRLDQMAHMLELLEASRFRIIAYERAAAAVRDLSEDIADLADDPKRLKAIEGIGAKMADKITAFVETGSIPDHEELKAEVPEGLVPLLGLSGLGPKTVRLLWKQLGVEDAESLQRVIDDGSILGLPRMGEKTVENIKRAIAFAQSSGERVPLGVARPMAEAIVAHMEKVKGVTRAAYAGSLRRGRETIGDIDILVSAKDPTAAHEAFCTMESVTRVLAQGATKSSVQMELGKRAHRWSKEERAIQVDLRVVPEASWGAALLYFTGSKNHNVRLRERALAQGMTLNEYGLYPNDDDPAPPQQRNVKAVASRTEASVYKALGVPELPPEIREDRGEVKLNAPPPLIEASDIKAELHAHTNASDGQMEIEALARAAAKRGYHTIAVTDHSRSSAQAGGLDGKRLREQAQAIQRVRDELGSKISILHGSEVDILADGSLDFDDETLALLDHVVASPHAALTQDPATATKRLIRAIENPHTRVLGHPTGRVFGRREGLSPEMRDVIAAAVEQGVALEINAHWLRLDLRDTHVRAAVEAGALIAIDCDVHREADFDHLIYGILTARRGWVSPEQCVNTWDRGKLHAWLKDRHTQAREAKRGLGHCAENTTQWGDARCDAEDSR